MIIVNIAVTPDGRVNRKDAAAYLGVAVKSLANRAYQGLAPRAVKVGGRCFYYIADLDAFIGQGGRA